MLLCTRFCPRTLGWWRVYDALVVLVRAQNYMLTISEITRYRFHNQHIRRAKFEKPGDVVAWLGAMQGQEYAMAKWGVAQRMKEIADAEQKAIAEAATQFGKFLGLSPILSQTENPMRISRQQFG